jgi:hypothetical protein
MSNKNPFRINVLKITGGNAAISSDNGDIVFQGIDKAFRSNISVIIDFINIEIIVSTFLNASIGQLYGSYESEFIRSHLKVENMSNDDLGILKKVVERAKEYFRNKKNFESTIEGSL